VVADPDNRMPDILKDRQIGTTPIAVSVPTVTLEAVPDGPLMGKNYLVRAAITNNGPLPLPFDLHWNEQYLTDPNPQNPAREGDIDVGRIDPGVTQRADLGTFSHTWQWISPDNPITLDATIDSLIGKLGKKGLKENLKALLEASESIFEGISVALNLIDAVNKYLAPVRENTIDYRTVLTYGLPSPLLTSTNVVLQVPSEKRAAYMAYLFDTVFASEAFSATIASLFTGQLEAAIPLSILGIAALNGARIQYDQAKDPPDSNYKQPAVAQPLDLSELASVPEGFLKEFAQEELSLEALLSAEAVSRNRAEGAALAGDVSWEARQQLAAAQFAAQEVVIEARLAAMTPQLETLLRSLQPGASRVALTVQSTGLPSPITQLLLERGWTSAEIDGLRTNLLTLGSDGLNDPSLATLALQLAPVASAAAVLDGLQQGVQFLVGPLGQPVQSLTREESQSLEAARSSIENSFGQPVPPADLGTQILGFLSQAYQLLLSTNNAPALLSDLDFGYSALARLGLFPPAPSPVAPPRPFPGGGPQPSNNGAPLLPGGEGTGQGQLPQAVAQPSTQSTTLLPGIPLPVFIGASTGSIAATSSPSAEPLPGTNTAAGSLPSVAQAQILVAVNAPPDPGGTNQPPDDDDFWLWLEQMGLPLALNSTGIPADATAPSQVALSQPDGGETSHTFAPRLVSSRSQALDDVFRDLKAEAEVASDPVGKTEVLGAALLGQVFWRMPELQSKRRRRRVGSST
jgi:hypothetical protein